MKYLKYITVSILVALSSVAYAANYQPSEQAMGWVALDGTTVLSYGTIEVGDVLASKWTVVHGEGENAFLQNLAPYASDFPSLPSSGWLEQGDIYNYNGQAVLVRQSHNRTLDDPSTVPALFAVYRVDSPGIEWIANESVVVGTERTYNGVLYKCIQSHITQTDWTPDKTPTLWSVVPTSSEWAVGVAYKVGDIVTYQGSEYKCLQAHTSQAGWTPTATPALWQAL